MTTEFSKFLSYYRPYKGLLTLILLAALFTAALSLVFPLLIRHITRDVLESGLPVADMYSEIFGTGILMLLVILLQAGFRLFYDYKGHQMGAKIERDMRDELFAHYQKMPFTFFDGKKTGELMSRLTNDLLNIAELMHHFPENIVIYGTQFVGAFVILMFINPRLTLVICAILPFMAVLSFLFFGRLRKSYAQNRERIAEVNACAEENLSGIRVVKSFSNEGAEVRKFSIMNMRFFKNRSEIYLDEALHSGLIEEFFSPLIIIAIIVMGGNWIAGGTLDPADLLVFVLLSAYLRGPVPRLAFMVQQYQEGMAGYRRLREITKTETEDKDHITEELKIAAGEIEFKGVSFRYNDTQEYVLRDINLRVPAGQTLAIVGYSGVGKTTLCALIPRFYKTCSGDILIDGKSIRNINLHSLRQQIGVVSQDTFLFSGTVMDNILFGKPGANEEEVIRAAKRANAHDFIVGLPRGYQTEIGQRGVMLSGGQRQRLGIARVFLKNPPVLIFDEATSALDYKSEKTVMNSLAELARGRTTLIIAHRLSTVRGADSIIVLTENGIAEQGTHDELYKSGGEYAKLYNANEM